MTEHKTEQTHNHLMSILVFVCKPYILSYGESKSTASYVLLSMNVMSTLIFEYE